GLTFDSWLQTALEIETPDETMQIVRVNPEQLRRVGVTAVRALDCADDQSALGVVQRAVVLRQQLAVVRTRFEKGVGQVFLQDAVGGSHYDRALDRVLKLAHVARPTVSQQRRSRFP